ncbi:MAG: site-specific integrase [Actinomycetia bacterium]|nr:site-specific integrase [Actinomycetes bacterium]
MRERSPRAANGKLQATVFKKCDRTYHRPETNKQCVGGTCQHTCEASEIGKCRHAWTVRYTVNGVQRDRSFRDEIDAGKRVRYGTGLRKAQDFQLELTRGKRSQGKTYVDPKAGNELFGPACEAFIMSSALNASPDSRARYLSSYRANVRALFVHRTLAQMCTQAAADEVAEFLNVTIAGRSVSLRRQARMIITGTMDAAARAEKIGRHKLTGIKLTEGTRTPADDDDDDEADGFVFIDDATIGKLADGITVTGQAGKTRTLAGVGVAAWMQRTMGLRIREALGVEKADFKEKRNGERYLRLRGQASRDGRSRQPLKHRKESQGRNVPVPDYVWDMVAALPEGPLCPGPSTRYMQYHTAYERFRAITEALKIDGYTTHSLRHQFASECLDDGMNVVDLSAVLGHADPSVTLRTYVHAMPDAEARTRAMMNARWTARPALEAAA